MNDLQGASAQMVETAGGVPDQGKDLPRIEIHQTPKHLEFRIPNYGKDLSDEIQIPDIGKDLSGIKISQTPEHLELLIPKNLPDNEIRIPDIGKQGSGELYSPLEARTSPSITEVAVTTRLNAERAENKRLHAENKRLQAENKRLQAISEVRQLQREVTPAYLVAASYEINRCLGLAREGGSQAVTQLAKAGHESCEALRSLCTDEGFYAALTELDRLKPADYQQALRLIDDNRSFDNFLRTVFEMLRIAGMPSEEARGLVRRCRWYLENHGRFERLAAESYLQHLRQLRDATCDLAEGELRGRVKQLKRRRTIRRIYVVLGTAGLKQGFTGLGLVLQGPEGAMLGSFCGDVAAQLATELVNEED